jgi:ubiquinone/menaquinone biosynthesis C-methylase UbiE
MGQIWAKVTSRALNADVLSLLRDPSTQEDLLDQGDALVNTKSGRRYPIRDGIPVFLTSVSGQNEKYQRLYDRIAVLYDPGQRLYIWLTRKPPFQLAYMSELEVSTKARVLEVSIGTGANLPFIRSDAEIYGLDLSWGMLRQCRKNLRRWKRTAELFQGEAEQLPFRDEVFDVVFHVGGINFFNDGERAIREMIRVAKPGTKLMIVDETEKVVKRNYEKNPLTRKYYKGRVEAVASPLDLVPREMREIASLTLLDGKLYCVTFRKP